MGRIAFVFSGQGAQYPGMGREIYETLPTARAMFDRFEVLRPGTLEQCFHGDSDSLKITANTQPCMFAMEVATAAALMADGIRPHAVAGFSLGELSALTCANVLEADDGFGLVCRRGEIMQKACDGAESGMVAVLRLDAETVEDICDSFNSVWPVNYNCPGQISVAALKDELPAFCAAVKEKGGRAMPLKVAGAFHSPLMGNAAREFACELQNVRFHAGDVCVYSDRTGLPYSGDTAELLAMQICSPVRWQQIIEDMAARGADTFIEIGPGKTLCGMISRTLKSARVLHCEDMASYKQVLAEVKSC